MKKLFLPFFMGLTLVCLACNGQNELKSGKNKSDYSDRKLTSKNQYNDLEITHKELISKEFDVSGSSFLGVYNIFGDIKVEPHNGNKVVVVVEEIIYAKTEADLQEALKEVKLGFNQEQDSLAFYTAEPYDSRPKLIRNKKNEEEKRDYIIHLNYTIKVPQNMALELSTVNNGDIEANDLYGKIKAHNINGAITLKNTKEAYDVNTINGEVNIVFLNTPPENSRFYTLNGTMNLSLPADFSADCELKSFNGDFYTDFNEYVELPSKMEKKVKNEGNSATYKLTKTNAYRFGKGGRNIKIETFNGNIFLKKQS